jgi:diguanylate cyclase (GGDEF)-like protein
MIGPFGMKSRILRRDHAFARFVDVLSLVEPSRDVTAGGICLQLHPNPSCPSPWIGARFKPKRIMSTSEFNQTIEAKTKSLMGSNEKAKQNGCLIRIHPLEIENKLIRLPQSTTTIGRDQTNDICCDNSSVSRKHAIITPQDFGFVIEDSDSTNGTFVNGRSISSTQLRDGAKIQVGNHIFKFLAGDSIESQYHETMYAMMTKDSLTDVFNKRFLIDALSREFERSQTYGRVFCIVMIDIDFFKRFNDTYGHLVGDEVLQEFARRINQECGANRIFARFGGEEFALLLVETTLQQATEFAEAMRKKIGSTPFSCCAGKMEVTASFGVAQYDNHTHESFSAVLDQADRHLYIAKANGRNQVCAHQQ